MLLSIPASRIDLVLESTEDVLARIDAMSPADRAEVSPDWIARLRASSPTPWTHAFAVIERSTGQSIGMATFKGPPDDDGITEIAYAIDEPSRGQGFAREAAAALVSYAMDNGARGVRAHTLPTRNPSTSVLTACGFTKLGEVIDPEDGLVWRWEYQPSHPA